MKHIAVFCGSNQGSKPQYLQAAEQLGKCLASQGIGLIYGAGNSGLMGALAQAALDVGGNVIGVTPRMFMSQGVIHTHLTQLHVVENMHARKALIHRMADGFITLPGGLGTLEELFETLTWSQLGLHNKPSGLLNTCGYFDGVRCFLQHATREGFLKVESLDLCIDQDVENLVQVMLQHIDERLKG